MKRIEFRKLKMFDKLTLIKETLMSGGSKETIASMIDECIYNTGTYVNGTSKRKDLFDEEEIKANRLNERKAIFKYEQRSKRWNADDIATEARKRYEEAVK